MAGREGVITQRVFPWRKGLATAGQQSTIPEDALWQAKNTSPGLDGMMSKRPGLRQWGQTIQTSTTFEPFLDDNMPGWVETNDDAALLTKKVDQGMLRMTANIGTGTQTHTLSWLGTAVTNPVFRMMVQAGGLKAITGAATDADTFHFQIAKDTTTAWEFAIWSGGLYYKAVTTGIFTLIAGTSDIGEGAWTQLEINITAAGNTLVYFNGTLKATIATSLLDATPTMTTANSIAVLMLQVQNNTVAADDEVYGVLVVAPTWGTSTAQTIESVSDFRASIGAGTQQSALLCAAGDYIWHDSALLGVWRPLWRKEYANVHFFPFRQDVGWVESNGHTNSRVVIWTGRQFELPEELENAPNAQFATEHQTRLWLAGDHDNPMRLSWSGDREVDVWFAPDQNNISDRFDTQLKAGYVEIASRRGDKITGIYGGYFGEIIVLSKNGVFRVQGSGPQSYAISQVGHDLGSENIESVAQVGNDVWFLSRRGIHTLSASDKFGDLISGYISGPIQDIFGGDASSTNIINKTYSHRSRLAYNSELGLVYAAVPLNSNSTAQNVYVYSVVTQEWYGPWVIDCQAMEEVTLNSSVIMHGGTAGKLLYTDQLHKSDDGTAIDMIMESATINGRTIDPSLVPVEKTFKRLRLLLLPRGDWDVKVFWKVDGGFYQAANTADPEQNKDTNVFNAHVLTDDFRLGLDPDGRLHSREEHGYVEIIVDARGYGLSFYVQQSSDGEDLAIQGYEVDFIAHGYSRD